MSDDVLIGLNDLMSSAHCGNVEFELTTDSDETEGASAVIVESENGRHGIRVAERDTDEPAALLGLHHDERMDTGEPASSSATVVAWVLSRRPKGISAGIKSELVHTITETIDDLRGEFHVHLNVLIGKDKSLLPSVDVPVVGILHVLNSECECVSLR